MKDLIVVKKDEDEVVGLDKNGVFYKLRNRDCAVGDSIRIGFAKRLMIWAMITVLILTCGFASLLIAYITSWIPVTYVSIDINPGIEFTLNRQNEVLSINPTNEAAKILISGKDYKGENIEDCAKDIMATAYDSGYFSIKNPSTIEDEPFNAVMVAVVNDSVDRTEKIGKEIKAHMIEYFSQNGIYSVILSFCKNNISDLNPVGNHISLGKSELIKVVQKVDKEQKTIEEYTKMPIKDLNKIIYSEHEEIYEAYEEEREKYEKHLNKNIANFKQIVKPQMLYANPISVLQWIKDKEEEISESGINWEEQKKIWQEQKKYWMLGI